MTVDMLLTDIHGILNRRHLMRCHYSSHLTRSSRLVAPFLNKLPVTERAVTEFLRPEIDRRMALMKECGKEYPDKPVSPCSFITRTFYNPSFQNDFLQWMLDHTFGGPDFNDVETVRLIINSGNCRMTIMTARQTHNEHQFHGDPHFICSSWSAFPNEVLL